MRSQGAGVSRLLLSTLTLVVGSSALAVGVAVPSASAYPLQLGQSSSGSVCAVPACPMPSSHAVSVAPSGYQLVASDGGIFAFDAPFHGSTGNLHLKKPIVGIAPDPKTGGYWLVASDGGVFAFDAPFHGSAGNLHLKKPIVGMAPDLKTGGYWLVASDGGVFAFDAPFHGSTGNLHLNKPIVAMTPDPQTAGYWLVASDGGIFAFDAPFHGSTGHLHLNKPIVAMTPDPQTAGYWLVASDGGIFAFDAPFDGSEGNVHLNKPIVAVVAPTLSSVSIRIDGLAAGVAGQVAVSEPNGRKVLASSGVAIYPAQVGTWTIVSTPVTNGQDTFYPSETTTTLRVELGGHASVVVDYANAIANTTRVATPSAVQSVSVPPGGGRVSAVVYDPSRVTHPGDVLTVGAGVATPEGLLLDVKAVASGANGYETVTGAPGELTDIGPQATAVVNATSAARSAIVHQSGFIHGTSAAPEATGSALTCPARTGQPPSAVTSHFHHPPTSRSTGAGSSIPCRSPQRQPLRELRTRSWNSV